MMRRRSRGRAMRLASAAKAFSAAVALALVPQGEARAGRHDRRALAGLPTTGDEVNLPQDALPHERRAGLHEEHGVPDAT